MDPQRRNRKRLANFEKEEKKRLAQEVRARPAIWDVSHPSYSNKTLTDHAWQSISDALCKPEQECKLVWKALRDSYRYHCKIAQKAENGQYFDYNDDWEFSDVMDFLPNLSRRSYFIQHEESMLESHMVEEETILPDVSCNYQITLNPTDTTSSQSAKLLETMSRLMEKQEELLTFAKKPHSSGSPFREALDNFDWLLKKLPRDVADSACLEISNILMRKVMEHKKKGK